MGGEGWKMKMAISSPGFDLVEPICGNHFLSKFFFFSLGLWGGGSRLRQKKIDGTI